MSHNDELRLLGQTGDDEEDLMEGREELFSGSTEVPIDVGDDGGDAAAGGEEAETQSAAAKEATRSCTSDVWDDFEKIFKVVNGKNIRASAKCIHCGQIYVARSTIDTGLLLRHRMKCSIRNQKTRGVSQSLIRFKPDGSVAQWEYSHDVALTQLCRLIARLDLPLSFGESDAFEEYIKLAHNPRFVSVSRQTTSRDLVKYFSDRRSELMQSLKSVSSVARAGPQAQNSRASSARS
jgi:hypothetical protein